VNLLILVVDDEPDVELLFRQQFRHDLRAGRFSMEFAQSATAALQRITDAGTASLILILILSDIDNSFRIARSSKRNGVWLWSETPALDLGMGIAAYLRRY
jgi:CheY-like chemotaxis protein